MVFKAVSAKYTRSMAERVIPEDFRGAINELSYKDEDESRAQYHYGVVRAILDTGIAGAFINSLCDAIRRLCVAQLYIIGDIYDRGAHPDLIMDELMAFQKVDLLWGNHDIHWLGAALGNPALIAGVIRQGISYNTFDLFEDGYGLNLRPLSVFANEVYADDPCLAFRPKDQFNINLYDTVDPDLGRGSCCAGVRSTGWTAGTCSAAWTTGRAPSRSTAGSIPSGTAASPPSTPRIPCGSAPGRRS